MEFCHHHPPPALAEWVKGIWSAQGTRQEFAVPEPIVPDGCVEIIFNLADRFADHRGPQPLDLIAGQMTGPVTAVPTGDVDLIGVRFRPGRGGAALGTPMWELQDSLIDASAIVSGIGRLSEDLRNMRADRRLAYLDAQLPLYLAIADAKSSSAVDHALEILEFHRGSIAIETVARRVGITRRHLERRFKDDVGLGVKHMARIRRVHAALDLMREHPRLSGAEISAWCGYSDQAHLIRECKSLTGQTPARLTTSASSLAGLMRGAGASRSA